MEHSGSLLIHDQELSHAGSAMSILICLKQKTRPAAARGFVGFSSSLHCSNPGKTGLPSVARNLQQ